MATDVVEIVAEEVADNLEEIAEVTRRLNANHIGLVLGGVAIGAAVGFYFGYRFNKEKLRAEAFAESEKQVEQIREVYQQKAVAAEPKPTVEQVMEQRGYSMAAEEMPRPLPAPVPITPHPVSAPPVVVTESGGKDKNDGWDFPTEIAQRSPDEPYVIHQDEFTESIPGYSHVTYTYYAEDDVLVDEGDGHPLPHADLIVGVQNLKFGHGADDINVVFVRNDRLQTEMEICRSPHSYEESVLGLERDADED